MGLNASTIFLILVKKKLFMMLAIFPLLVTVFAASINIVGIDMLDPPVIVVMKFHTPLGLSILFAKKLFLALSRVL